MVKKYRKNRKKVARFMRRLYLKGLTTTSGGNISLRLSDDIILITPSATDKGEMRWKEIGIMTIPGENLTPENKPSIESEMHLRIYRTNRDVKAIVHAHPVFASSFTAMDCKIDTSLTAEARAICGEPVFVPYALMGSSGLAEIAATCSAEADIMLLENHGIITTGSSLLNAFDKIEVLENAAKMTFITSVAGKCKRLSQKQLKEIDKLFR